MDPRAKLVEALMAGPQPDTSSMDDIMRLLAGKSMPLGARESENVQDERNFANEPGLIRGNAQLASEVANLYSGLKYYMNKLEPQVSLQEIGDLLPNNRLGGFAAPMMRGR